MLPPDTQFMIWGTGYVILKWTVGLWAVRRVKARIARWRAA
jgi:hypothetical protein